MAVGIALLLGGALIQAPAAGANSKGSKIEFIASLVGAAQSTQRKFGVPASVSIAQAIEASNWGASNLSTKANNYFETPCGGSMTASHYADLAEAQVGKPYVLGANGPSQFDCSSLVIWLNNQSGAFRMGDDTAAGLYNRGRAVVGSPKVGDMVFLRNNPARSNGIGHMAVLTRKLANGDWRIIEARGRAFGVVRSTLGFWKKRSYYAGIRRFAKLTYAATGGVAASAARLYQSGCATVGSTRYANFSSMTNSFYANGAAITSDPAYKTARSVITSIPEFVDALAKVVEPKDPDGYARTLNSLIDSYSLTDYDVVPIGIVLKSGRSGAKVTALQYLLQASGYRVAASGEFDSATVSAVKKLQKAKKLEVDGEGGRYTLPTLFAKLGSGAKGARTSAIHELLEGLGYATTPDSEFGSATLASVKSFQATAGRDATGTVDNQTWAALFMTLDGTQPQINGTPEIGQTLTGNTSDWGPGSVSLSYQWYRGSSPIRGATEKQYEVQIADAGSSLHLVVTGLKAGYTVTARGSAPSEIVPPARFTSTPAPKIDGTPRVNEILAAILGPWTPGDISLAYQWNRDGKAIQGATTARYLVHPDDAAAQLTVSVTGSKPGFTTVTKTSAATVAVEKARLTTEVAPKISGSPKMGKTLTALPGEWGPGVVSYTYQWYRGSKPISGATGKTYTTRTADRSNTLYVAVTGSRDGYLNVASKSARVKIV